MHADDLHLLAVMGVSRQAFCAAIAGNMRFPRHPVTDGEPPHGASHLHNIAAEFMPEHHGKVQPLLGPGRPVIDMLIRAADGRIAHLHQNFVVLYPGDCQVIADGGSRFGRFLYQSLHCSVHIAFSSPNI